MNIERKVQGHACLSGTHLVFKRSHKTQNGGFYTVPLKELHIPPFWAKMRYMF